MKKFLLFLLFNAFSSLNVCAQKQDNIWIFGDSCGISFQLGFPQIIDSVNINSIECSASIADSSGNLLFYVGPGLNNYDSLKVWNNNLQVMPNGAGIYGYASATQGALIIPFPDDTLKYYLFTILPTMPGFGSNLHYSIVDLSLNGNTGDVTAKNMLLSNLYFTEKLSVAKHGNGRDWWLIAHEGYSINNRFIKFLITPSGIQGPFFQNIGTLLDNGDIACQMKFSNSGTKLVLAGMSGTLNIFDFDRCTGIFSNTINLNQVFSGALAGGFYGCAFSSNENVLYVSQLPDTVYQYDLTAANVMLSKNILMISSNNCENGQLQLAPDNKIYMATFCGGPLPNNIFTNENMNLTVINNPDVFGPGCNIAPYSFNLGGRRSFLGLPNMQNYKLGRWVSSPCDTLTVGISEIENKYMGKIYPNPSTGVVNYEYRMEKGCTGSISFTNTWGQVLKRIPLIEGQNQLTIDCGNFADGIYLYQVIVNNNTIARDKLTIIKE